MDLKKKLTQLRREVDYLDSQLLDLLLKRFALSRRIGHLKRLLGLPIHDPHREGEIINSLTQRKTNNLSQDDIATIFRPIYKLSKKFQQKVD